MTDRVAEGDQVGFGFVGGLLGMVAGFLLWSLLGLFGLDELGHSTLHGLTVGGATMGAALGRQRSIPRAMVEGFITALMIGFGTWLYRMSR
jgi:hypothetical protein